MPVGWAIASSGKRRVLESIDRRIEGLRSDKTTIVTRAGEAALSGNSGRVAALKEQHDLIAQKIQLLTEVRSDVVNEHDTEW